jgi:prepilin-type processing-associated H-X9-DG protein
MAIIETASKNGPWRAAGLSTIRGLDRTRLPYLGRAHQFGGLHRGGAMVGFADGSVRFIRETIEPGVLESISTIAGAEQLPSGWSQ